jgi:hypothetical protein
MATYHSRILKESRKIRVFANGKKSGKKSKKENISAEFCTHGQIKMETNENGTYPQISHCSDDVIENSLWILQIVFSTIIGLFI